MRCKASILGAKEYYEDNEGRYYEERDEAFLQHIMDQVKSYLDGKENVSIDEFREEVEDFDILTEIKKLCFIINQVLFIFKK